MNSTGVLSASHGGLSAQQRAAFVTYQIFEHEAEFTTTEIADMLGMTVTGAHLMMDRLSGVLPLVRYNSRWRRFD